MSSQPSYTDAESAAYVEAIVRRAGSSFYWAMRRLPEQQRLAMYAIYAFCREVDDIADEGGSEQQKRIDLGLWRGEIERLYGDRPRNPIALALQRPVEVFGLQKEDFRAVIDGMEMDAEANIRIADMDELTLYCDRVACAVGRLSVRVFGLEDELGHRLAFHQGLALQLTNILRDIAEDADRGRLYIPRDLLVSYDIAAEDLPSIFNHLAFPKVCETLADVAERHFAQADAAAAECDREQIRPAIMMMEIYRRIFAKLKRRGWQYLNLPVGLSKIGKLWVALRYGLF
ncbi:MAG: presqualene diphosphate synthase HpnD [Proteobacteria bacterium]|nr:presqualene diphosphate synthase HpnD [Pseudomonadota bacterium]